MKKTGKVLNKHYLKGCEQGNAYVFQNTQRKNKWSLYFTDKKTKERFTRVLQEEDDRYPSQTLDGLPDAERLGTRLYFELRSKTDRGEKTNSLSIQKMVELYIDHEKKRINPLDNPDEETITKDTFRRVSYEIKHYLNFIKDKEWGLGRSIASSIHLMDINHLATYFNYRRRTINKFDKHGKALPRKSTIIREIYNIRRAYEVIGVSKRYINQNQIPLKPKKNMKVSTKETQDTRRSMFDRDEIESLLEVGKKYYQHGISKFDRKGDLYGFQIENGKPNYDKPIRKSVIFGKGTSNRAKHQIKHRKMVFLAMRFALETGLRIGVLKQIKWSNIVELSAKSKRNIKENKLYKEIRVPSYINKTGEYLEIPARITESYDELKNISDFTKPDDFIFSNQKTGEMWSERIWTEALVDIMIEADLADLKKVDENGKRPKTKSMIVRSGKTITWYSFRHSMITFMLNSGGMQLHEVSEFCDTDITYIKKHYYHPDLLSPEILDKLDVGHDRETKKVQKLILKDYDSNLIGGEYSLEDIEKLSVVG